MNRRAKLGLTHMWHGPGGKVFLRESPSDGAVICPACQRGRYRLATVKPHSSGKFEPLVQRHQSGAIPDHNLDPVSPFGAIRDFVSGRA